LLLMNCRMDPALPIARLSSLRKLELFKIKGMTHLPDDLWQLPDLRELTIIDCSDFDHIPDDIPADAKLESLILDVEISRLLTSLCGLSNLTRLTIASAKTEELPDGLSRLTSLRILALNKTNVSRLPPNMDRLTNLEEVMLSTVRAGIGGAFRMPMPAMRRLDIAKVAANAQNIDWSGLRGLTDLRIALANDQSQLHPSIGSLSSLQTLTFNDCGGLTTLPAAISGLSSLAGLHLGKLRTDFTLPDAISGLASLRVLYASGNGHELHIPPTIRLPTSLTAMAMMQVDTQLPPSLSTLSRLRELRVDYDFTEKGSLPVLRRMPSVRHLVVKIVNFDADQGICEMLAHASLTCLKMVSHPANNLAPVLGILPTLTNLRELHLMQTTNNGDFPEPAVLEIPSSISKLTSVTYLALKFSVAAGPPEGLFLLTSLRRLELGFYDSVSTNELAATRLSPAVSKLVNLRDLQLLPQMMLCASITRLSALTSVRAKGDGDLEHQEAVKALLNRRVKYMSSL
jgi:hypothetical protein